MRNFEIPQMKISIFTKEEILTDSITEEVKPQQLAAIEAFNQNGDSLVGRASFTELMKIN